MHLSEIINLLQAKVLIGDNRNTQFFDTACASDLMSNVLAYSGIKALLITTLNNVQVIRTAEMSEISTIVFVQGKNPSVETLELAKEKGITILGTDCSLFTSCGILYSNGMRCGFDYDVC